MSNSKLVSYTRLSPNHSGTRTHSIDRITPHCVVGQLSVETLGSIFAPTARMASSNYGIGTDGRVGMYVEEKNRSWCSSSNENDQRAVTIECASDLHSPYAFNEKVWNKLVLLCADICKRNGKKRLVYKGSLAKTEAYEANGKTSDEMMLTVHRWFADTDCPGNWLMNRLDDLVREVNKKLGVKSKITLTNYNYPRTLKKGNPFVIKGKIKSAWALRKVTVVVENYQTGKDIAYATYSVRLKTARTYSLSNIDPHISFKKLPVGTYRYKVKATDSNGATKTLLSKKFTVKKK